MYQIIVLEKHELKDLSHGGTMTLKLPSGEDLQLQGEGRVSTPKKTPMNGAGPTIREVILGQQGWFRSAVIKEKTGGWGAIFGTLKRMEKHGEVRVRPAGKRPNGMPTYEYKVIKGAAQ